MSTFVYLLPESYALSKDNLKKEIKKKCDRKFTFIIHLETDVT